MLPYKGVLITGAGRGFGRALAEACARPGVTLHLCDLDPVALAEAAEACRALGATVATAALDVTDAAAMAGWIAGTGRLDLVIANAGYCGQIGGDLEAAAQVRRVFATNLDGMLNTALPALEKMAGQAPAADGLRGHVAVIASVLAFAALPQAAAYAASKAAAQRWAEAMDGSWRARGIRLHAVCPGFLRTELVAGNPLPMPMLMRASRAARLSLEGIAAGRLRVAFPFQVYLGLRLIGALPPAWRNRLMRWVCKRFRSERATA